MYSIKCDIKILSITNIFSRISKIGKLITL